GIPTHVASIIPDDDPDVLREGFATQFDQTGMDVGIRITGAPYLSHLRNDYYELDGRDGHLLHAWERFANEFGANAARDIFARWAGIFHPRTVVRSVDMFTGCSQGDWVELIVWVDEETVWQEFGHWSTRPTTATRWAEAVTKADDYIADVARAFEQAATGGAYRAEVHEVDATVSTADNLAETSITLERGDKCDSIGGLVGVDEARKAAREFLED
ncbi:UNVERIFIED_CONTAM: hypothetical protein IGO34_23610, partial [Salmonella enterica subsp. enterica serovar Weltevreden]